MLEGQLYGINARTLDSYFLPSRVRQQAISLSLGRRRYETATRAATFVLDVCSLRIVT